MSDEPQRDTPKTSPKQGAATRRDPGKGKTEASAAKKPAAAKKAETSPSLLPIVAAAVASLLIGILLGALIFGGDDGDDGGDGVVAASATPGTQIVTPEELATEAASLGRPVYWAGPQDGSSIEFTRNEEGNTAVRYVPEGEDVSEEGSLTVVTYPFPDAHDALMQQAAADPNLLSRRLPNGGFMISQANQPRNAYLAFEGEDYEVEVYDPRPGQALKLIIDGAIVPAG